jgi:hypothetical protein
MAKAKKRGVRRSKGARKASRRTKGKAKRRVSFPKLWRRLGNSVLRRAGKDRKALIANLAVDSELQQLVVERTVRLLSAHASEMASAAAQVPVREAPPSREETVAEEYALAAHAADTCCEQKSCDAAPAEEKADWRVF